MYMIGQVAALRLDGQHVAGLEPVHAATIERDDRAHAGLTDPVDSAVDPDHPAMHRLAWRVRCIVARLRWACATTSAPAFAERDYTAAAYSFPASFLAR
jgi:hypothetical protein